MRWTPSFGQVLVTAKVESGVHTLYDAISGETRYATTFESGGAGSHGGNAGFILQGLSEYLDGFILDYLRVNEAAC